MAEALGVSRQAVSLYIHGSTLPSAQTLTRAVHLWDLRLEVDGFVASKQQFPIRPIPPRTAEQLALDFFAEPREIPIPDSPLVLRIHAVDGDLQLSIRVREAA